MLWKYAPATDMDGDRPSDRLYGASGRHLQMGRRGRRGSLLRSVLAGRGKDHDGIIVGSRGSGGSAQRHRADRTSQRAAPGGLNYSEFSITSPTPDQTFFGDDVVAVHLDLNPALRPNQSITWHLNGKQLDFPPNAVSFALPRLDRGTYALAATITDQQTGDSQTSNSVTFFVRQPSTLSPQSPLRK